MGLCTNCALTAWVGIDFPVVGDLYVSAVAADILFLGTGANRK